MSARGEFSSRIGFILAAAGSAVGLGNIWGFPTQVASNGGAAFVLVYIILAFALAYPVLMAELIIGRATRANMVDALGQITGSNIGRATGVWGFITVSLILAFYALVAGVMISFCAAPLADLLGFTNASAWLTADLSSEQYCFLWLIYDLNREYCIWRG
jgi:NSS family neurotransmitter:Na+ symporter